MGRAASTIIFISSVEGLHAPLVMVHLKVLVPLARPVTPEEGEEGVVMVAAPEIKVQIPVPVVGVLPARVEAAAQMF